MAREDRTLCSVEQLERFNETCRRFEFASSAVRTLYLALGSDLDAVSNDYSVALRDIFELGFLLRDMTQKSASRNKFDVSCEILQIWKEKSEFCLSIAFEEIHKKFGWRIQAAVITAILDVCTAVSEGYMKFISGDAPEKIHVFLKYSIKSTKFMCTIIPSECASCPVVAALFGSLNLSMSCNRRFDISENRPPTIFAVAVLLISLGVEVSSRVIHIKMPRLILLNLFLLLGDQQCH